MLISAMMLKKVKEKMHPSAMEQKAVDMQGMVMMVKGAKVVAMVVEKGVSLVAAKAPVVVVMVVGKKAVGAQVATAVAA